MHHRVECPIVLSPHPQAAHMSIDTVLTPSRCIKPAWKGVTQLQTVATPVLVTCTSHGKPRIVILIDRPTK